MRTTSGTLTAGQAITGRNGKGKGRKGRAAGLVATAALGLSLLVGGIIGHARATVAPVASLATAAPPPVVIALGDRDDPRFAAAATAPHVYVALGDRDDLRFAGSAIARSTIADGSQPGLLEVLPGEPFVAGLVTTPSYRESHGIDPER